MATTLLEEIEAFLVRHDMPPSTFGRVARNDASFVFDLRENKRTLRRKTIKEVRAWMKRKDEGVFA